MAGMNRDGNAIGRSLGLLAACACAVALGGKIATAAETVTWPSVTSAVAPDPEVERRIDDVLSGLTPEQKVGQMTQAVLNNGDSDNAPMFPYGIVLAYNDTNTLGDALPGEAAVADAAAKAGNGSALAIFESRPIAPWKLFVGDEGGWVVPVTGSPASSPLGVVSVLATDRLVQEDARKVTWSGKGPGQFFFQGGARDLTDALSRDGAIVVDMRLDTKPSKEVAIRMDCGHPCGAKGDLTRLFEQVPTDTWFQFSVDLGCFAKQGTDFSKVDTPFLLFTEGELELTIAGVRIETGIADKATIKCR